MQGRQSHHTVQRARPVLSTWERRARRRWAWTAAQVYLRSIESFEEGKLLLWRAWPPSDADDSFEDETLNCNKSFDLSDQTLLGGAPGRRPGHQGVPNGPAGADARG